MANQWLSIKASHEHVVYRMSSNSSVRSAGLVCARSIPSSQKKQKRAKMQAKRVDDKEVFSIVGRGKCRFSSVRGSKIIVLGLIHSLL